MSDDQARHRAGDSFAPPTPQKRPWRDRLMAPAIILVAVAVGVVAVALATR